MKKFKFKNSSDIGDVLTREEIKHVFGGNYGGSSGSKPCSGKGEGAPCEWKNRWGTCRYFPFNYELICYVG